MLVLMLSVMLAAPAIAQPPPKPTPAAETIAQARKARAAGRTEQALELAESVLAESPKNREAAELKIGIFASGGDLKAAFEAYDAYARAASHDKPLLTIVATAVLAGLSKDASPTVRVVALERLTDGGDAAARMALQKARLSSDSLDARLATESLARLGDADARAALIGLAREGTSGNRSSALRALRTIDTPEVAAEVKAALRDSDSFVRAAAAEVAGFLKLSAVTETLKAAMAEPHPILRLSAAGALTRLGDPEGRAMAIETLASSLFDVRLMVAGPLASVGDTAWIAAIRPVLDDPNGLNRVLAAELMLNVDRQAASDLLVSAGNDPNPIIRAEAARVLSSFAGPLPAVRKLLGDASAQVRLPIAAGLVSAARPKTTVPRKPI